MPRIRQLDGVRALAILLVFAYHSVHVKQLYVHVKLFWIGVDLFFILSGFLITGVLLDRKQHGLGSFFARFYARRARRILVPYVMFLIVASCFVGAAWMRHWYYYVILTNLLLPLHIPFPDMFVPLWSLAVEEQFYLLWPLAVYFLRLRHLRMLCILLIAIPPLLRGTFHFADLWPIYMGTPFRMDLLATGGLLCLTWRSRRDLIEAWGAKAGIPLALAGFAALKILAHYGMSIYANSRVGNVLIYEASLLTCLGVMLYALSGKGTSWLAIRPLTYIGQISYSIYLVHLGVIIMVFPKFQVATAVVISFALSVAYASLSWFALEKRLVSRGHTAAETQLKPA
jgi:peptidoglycan/LPS O-acetylase OafA/YrhL